MHTGQAAALLWVMPCDGAARVEADFVRDLTRERLRVRGTTCEVTTDVLQCNRRAGGWVGYGVIEHSSVQRLYT